jgi:endonuclease-3
MSGSPPQRPFDVDVALSRIREAVRPYPPATLFQLADEGFRTPFEVLMACLISIRTRDEVSLGVSRRLFARARRPAELLALPEDELASLIRESSFPHAKARDMRTIAARAEADHGGAVPCDFAVLTSFPGVGPKCANLVLGIACDRLAIGVDVHVFRVTNRWGYVEARTPEQTMVALQARLPERYWVEINRLLVPFGKHICTGSRPRCSTCPVLDMCARRGVTVHR